VKILVVIPYFAPAWVYGGPVMAAYQTCLELGRRGHKVTVYTTDTLDEHNRIKADTPTVSPGGIEIHYFKNISNWLAFKHHLFISPGLIAVVKSELKSFDAIHMHEYRTFQNIIVRYYARKYGIPYILQAHSSLHRMVTKQKLKQVYDVLWGYKLLRDASKVIAITQTEAGQYKNLGVSEDKIEVVPNGVSLSEFKDLPERGRFRRKHGLNDNQKIILYLGRIHKTKGLDLLAKAFAMLSKEINDAKLIIVGPDDGYLPTLRNLITDLKIGDKVIFVGPLYESNKLEAYVDADVFVTPSFFGFPLTFVEACACGIPVVTTKKGDMLDWIHNQVGCVVEYNEKQLKNGVAKLLKDTNLAKQFRENGQKLARERFTWSGITNQLERIYLNAKLIP
jgi:glycosyltransferase involved in cell wall biosynthesis